MQWRQREFKVGGDVAPKEMGSTGNTPSPPERNLKGGKFFVFLSKMAYFAEFWGAKFKVFFIVSSLSGVWIDSVANFGFLSKTINKKTPLNHLNAVIGRGLLILVCYIRTYVIILTSPQPKYWRGCVPGIPGGVDASASCMQQSQENVHAQNYAVCCSVVANDATAFIRWIFIR